MISFVLLCLVNAVFSSISTHNEHLEAYTPSIERSEVLDHNKNRKDNFTSQSDLNDNYYRYQLKDFHKENSERRIFDWINNIIASNASEETLLRTKKTKNGEAADVTMNYRHIERNLTVTLTELSRVLTQLLNIIKYTRHDNFKSLNNALKSSKYDKNRYKRDVNETVKEEKEILHNTKEEKEILSNTKEEKEMLNNTKEENVVKDKDGKDNNETEKNGRRTMQVNPFVSNEVKERLLHYINEGFDEIKSKIQSLQQIKNMFSNNINYKIGYIIANLDNLDANMKKLNEHLDVNKRLLNDTKILSLYDTVKASTTAVSNLMDVLKKYLNTDIN